MNDPMSDPPADSAILDRSVFASIPDALKDMREGRIVLVVDDADRENEADFIMAAEYCTQEALQ